MQFTERNYQTVLLMERYKSFWPLFFIGLSIIIIMLLPLAFWIVERYLSSHSRILLFLLDLCTILLTFTALLPAIKNLIEINKWNNFENIPQ